MKSAIALLAVVGLTAAANAQLSFTGGTITQNFDGLPATTGSGSSTVTVTGRGGHALTAGFTAATGVAGWQGANFGGSTSNTEFRAQDGSLAGSNGRGVVSFGTAGSSDRALGALATSNQINAFGLVLRNDTSETITFFTLSYFGEQWRRGDVPSPNTLAFFYGIGSGLASTGLTAATSLNFVAPNTTAAANTGIDGNAAGNRTLVTGTITGLNWAPGTSLVLQWNAQDQSGQDDGLAIDDLTFVVPTPGAAAMLGLGALVAGRRRR